MKLYHGTSQIFAQAIAGPPTNVDVTKGKGEMGMGFYLGDSLSLALTRAAGKGLKSVLEFDIDNQSYAKLNLKQLSLKQVKKDWTELRKLKITNSYKYNVDVVFGPLATHPYACQYKFESIVAQNLLNSINTKITRYE